MERYDLVDKDRRLLRFFVVADMYLVCTRSTSRNHSHIELGSVASADKTIVPARAFRGRPGRGSSRLNKQKKNWEKRKKKKSFKQDPQQG
jgi:hypothetical protein